MRLLSNPYRRRWIGWGLLVAAFFLVSLHRSSTAVLSGELMRAFDTTATSLGLLHSSFFYLYAAFQVPAGLLTDRYGARATAATGTAVMSAGAVAFGLASTYSVAFGGRVLVGLGASVLFVAALRFCANWFRPDEFGTMTGATFSVGILGGLAATTPLAVAISRLGWRGSMVGLGVAGLAAAVGILLVSHDSPADAGLEPIDDVPDRPDVTDAATLKRYVSDAVREPETWLLGIMLFFMTGIGITIFGLWGIPYLVQTHGISVTEASVYLLVGNVGGMIGPTAFGWLSDRWGQRTGLIVFSTVVFGLTWAVFAAFGTVPLFLVGAIFLFSRVLRGGVPLAFTVIKERHPEGASGTVIGIVNTMGWIGAAVFPVVLGAALDAYWTGDTVNGTRVYTELGYRVAFAIAAAAGLLAAACAILLHVRTRAERPLETGTDLEQPTD
ncbi:MFS transporter [Natrinema thermotolerans]|uniref:Lysosomal dipeptide transporter MFSD1 n=1 Tax=Natrinema thermotolerans TaxID=121872 RepID=A0AAF0PEP0_9EURY|nr:MFS transporter [Natrinema thermotolerans]QCC60449.1 MFS transporter [Natrinema thermotolerans]QCC61352.1 MFS transporter [Natrinema thermotolerans]WMT07477.1 MFS transporter [Natrinema thermotolerans]WMT08109.1 MFS transporter [Natrinema thermotolerans]